MLGSTPSYRAIMAVDIEKSAGRGDAAMLATHEVLVRSLQAAFAASGLSWNDCHRTDLGDGLRIVAARGTLKARLVDPLIPELAALLRSHNRSAPAHEHIRLRVALHAGDVQMGDGQVVGAPLEMLARFLEAPPLRSALAEAPESRTVALGMSEHFYDEVVRRASSGIEADLYQRVPFVLKETATAIWIHVPGYFPRFTDANVSAPAQETTAQTDVPNDSSRWAPKGEVINIAAGRARVGQQIGQQIGTRIDHIRGDVHTGGSADQFDEVRRQLGDLRRALRDQQLAGRLDEETYEAAVDELRGADVYLTAPDPAAKSRFVMAMRRLKGLLEEVADLAAKVTAIIHTVRGL